MKSRDALSFALGLALAIAPFAAKETRADPLNPNDFASLGSLGPGDYTIQDKGAGPTLYSGNVALFAGVIVNGIAVFDFNAIHAGSVVVDLNEPLALLSRADATFTGAINVFPTSNSGPGSGGHGQGATYFDPNSGTSSVFQAGQGGGGFGAKGGNGQDITVSDPQFNGALTTFKGGTGGQVYGDLAHKLEMGSPGGDAGQNGNDGFGGGAIELGAVKSITVTAAHDESAVSAQGASAYNAPFVDGEPSGGVGGGGSGGAIFIHAPLIVIDNNHGNPSFISPLDVQGGGGASGISFASNFGETIGGAGGYGGDGRILLQGVVVSAVPEPSTLLLGSITALALLGESCRRRRTARG